MGYTKSKNLVQSKLRDEHSLDTLSGDFERDDDDDPLSIRSLSISFIGIIIALLTILVPLISVLIENSISRADEIILKKSIKKDGP